MLDACRCFCVVLFILYKKKKKKKSCFLSMNFCSSFIMLLLLKNLIAFMLNSLHMHSAT